MGPLPSYFRSSTVTAQAHFRYTINVLFFLYVCLSKFLTVSKIKDHALSVMAKQTLLNQF